MGKKLDNMIKTETEHTPEGKPGWSSHNIINGKTDLSPRTRPMLP